jgi:hypothetical protein
MSIPNYEQQISAAITANLQTYYTAQGQTPAQVQASVTSHLKVTNVPIVDSRASGPQERSPL